VNAQTYLLANKELSSLLKSQPLENLIFTEAAFNRTILNRKQLTHFSKELKLPENIILRLNDLLVYASLDHRGPKKELLTRIFRLSIKKRYYIKSVRDYIQLFKGFEESILGASTPGGLKEPYIYNSNMIEEDPFCRVEEEKEVPDKAQAGGMTQDQILAIEGLKIQLKKIYEEIVDQFEALRPKMSKIVATGA
jgi:hypothetical protein